MPSGADSTLRHKKKPKRVGEHRQQESRAQTTSLAGQLTAQSRASQTGTARAQTTRVVSQPDRHSHAVTPRSTSSDHKARAAKVRRTAIHTPLHTRAVQLRATQSRQEARAATPPAASPKKVRRRRDEQLLRSHYKLTATDTSSKWRQPGNITATSRSANHQSQHSEVLPTEQTTPPLRGRQLA